MVSSIKWMITCLSAVLVHLWFTDYGDIFPILLNGL